MTSLELLLLFRLVLRAFSAFAGLILFFELENRQIRFLGIVILANVLKDVGYFVVRLQELRGDAFDPISESILSLIFLFVVLLSEVYAVYRIRRGL